MIVACGSDALTGIHSSSAIRVGHQTLVEVWCAHVSAELANAWRAAIPSADRDVVEQLRDVERDRRVVQLAVRRSVVASHLGIPLAEVALGHDARGAIVCAAAGICLSASHHDDITVLALADGVQAVGVDVEPTGDEDWDAALDEVLTPLELGALEGLPPVEREPAYFTCWTMKEAVMKALGDGLSDRDPKSIEVAIPPAPPRLVSLDGQPSGAWSLATFIFEGYVCSVAVAGPPTVRFQLCPWPLDVPSGH
jgi:4'-phosphopantetheinyl transferase